MQLGAQILEVAVAGVTECMRAAIGREYAVAFFLSSNVGAEQITLFAYTPIRGNVDQPVDIVGDIFYQPNDPIPDALVIRLITDSD